MAQESGTTDSYDFATANREDIVDKIFDISPTDVPISSLIGKASKATATKHEWEYDALATADADNAAVEGDAFAYTDAVAPTKVANYTQIFKKTVMLSGTQQSVDSVANFGKMAKQIMKRNQEIKRDVEASIGSNNAGVVGTSSVARKSAGLRAIIETNSSKGATGADGGWNSGTGVFDAATDGTPRAFTKTIMDEVIQDCFNAGSEPKCMTVSGFVKNVFSGFMANSDVAQLRTNVTGNGTTTLVGGVDVYVSDFGDIAVKASRFQDQSSAFFIDPEYAGISILRKMQKITPAKTSDADKHVILTECTLEVGNEAAHGVAADLITA